MSDAPWILSGSELPDALAATRDGAADAGEILRVALRLAPRCGEAALEARAMALGAQPLHERTYLAIDALPDDIKPADEARQAVRAFCGEHGFTLEREALGGLFVTISGRAGDLAETFGVTLGTYRVGGRTIRAYDGALSLPAGLAAHVRAVHGLDEASRLAGWDTVPSSRPAADPPPSYDGNSPVTVASEYYDYPMTTTGKGTTVAFLETNLHIDEAELQTYYAKWGRGSPVNIVVPEGVISGSAVGQASAPNGEAMMDLSLTGAVAPDATLVVYSTGGYYGYASDLWIDAVLAAIENRDYPPDVISISLGGPEVEWVAQTALTLHIIFAVAGLLGITICVSSGDYGAPGKQLAQPSGNHVQNCAFPASSSFCLACGGTELVLDEERVLQDEIVWNGMQEIYQKRATGGGISIYFAVPPYQEGVALPTPLNPMQGAGRGLPDVSCNASYASGYMIAGDHPHGNGTSAAAPMWAALAALLIEAGGKRLGFLNPLLYGAQLDGEGITRPITEGNNGPPPPDDWISFPAGAPWNACCGLGSPLGKNIAAALGIDVSS